MSMNTTICYTSGVKRKEYYVYVVECSDATFYIGITNDLDKRIFAHNNSKTGAKYTRGRRPVILKYSEECKNKNEALKREYELKKLSRQEKRNLVEN